MKIRMQADILLEADSVVDAFYSLMVHFEMMANGEDSELIAAGEIKVEAVEDSP